jgi:carboxymethylenebutenolidase
MATETKHHDIVEMWQRHTYAEFVLKDADAAVETMTDDAYVLLGPIMSAAEGKSAIREFYANRFLNQIPADLTNVSVSRAVSDDLLIEEMSLGFTHDIQMDWLLPGIPPTRKRVELTAIGVIGFRDGKLAFERLYWDQASVLLQLGILDASTPAVTGAESARLVLKLSGAGQL